jgi:protein-disulfide isomerase
MSRRFLIILAALVVIFFGVVIYSKNNKDSNSDTSGDSSGGSSYIQGAGTDGVTLVEFGDFQCPACRSYYPVTKQIKDKYGDRIKFQFRHFPLVQIHQNAMVAHRAAEAAGRQGKFWQMHDLLYERQQSWESSKNPTVIMEDYASELGLNVDKFKADFASESVNDTIQADIRAGQAAGANSTPTFVLNGKKLEPLPTDLAGFSQLIDEQIAQQGNQQ